MFSIYYHLPFIPLCRNLDYRIYCRFIISLKKIIFNMLYLHTHFCCWNFIVIVIIIIITIIIIFTFILIVVIAVIIIIIIIFIIVLSFDDNHNFWLNNSLQYVRQQKKWMNVDIFSYKNFQQIYRIISRAENMKAQWSLWSWKWAGLDCSKSL